MRTGASRPVLQIHECRIVKMVEDVVAPVVTHVMDGVPDNTTQPLPEVFIPTLESKTNESQLLSENQNLLSTITAKGNFL